MGEILGDDLPALSKAERKQVLAEAVRVVARMSPAARKAAIDAADGKTVTVPPELPGLLRERILGRTDKELTRDALAIQAFRGQGYTYQRISTQLGETVQWVRETLRVARERNLLESAVVTARQELADTVVPLAVDAVRHHVKRKNLDAALATLKGLGILDSGGAGVGATTNLQVNIVMGDGSQPPPATVTIPGVVGRPAGS